MHFHEIQKDFSSIYKHFFLLSYINRRWNIDYWSKSASKQDKQITVHSFTVSQEKDRFYLFEVAKTKIDFHEDLKNEFKGKSARIVYVLKDNEGDLADRSDSLNVAEGELTRIAVTFETEIINEELKYIHIKIKDINAWF